MADPPLSYRVPWTNQETLAPASVDLIMSQAVFEHVDDLEGMYRSCFRWLRPGGLMTAQIDFRSHETARAWNGHWTFSKFVRFLIKGRLPYLINREPYTTHLRCLAGAGFDLVSAERETKINALVQRELALRFRHLSTEDLSTSGLFVLARKPATEESGLGTSIS